MLEHLYTALRSTYGIILACDDINTLRNTLYNERRAAKDPDLACISLVPSPVNPQHLWLVNRTTLAAMQGKEP